MQDIWEALEATAHGRSKYGNERTASGQDIKNHRDYILRFLTELDAGLTVGEIREALDEYAP